MNVYKFGGASVKDAEGVKNLFKIINTQRENLIIVVSAMGKMTDALEVMCNSYFGKTGNIAEVFQRIQDFHQQIIRDLFGSADSEVNARVEALYQELDTILKSDPSLCYDYEYDRIICFGELLSTTIIASYLEKQLPECLCRYRIIGSVVPEDIQFSGYIYVYHAGIHCRNDDQSNDHPGA